MFEDLKIKVEGGFELSFPRMMKARQKFKTVKLDDIPRSLAAQFCPEAIREKIRPGMRVAIAVGSRGIHRLRDIVTEVVVQIKKLGGDPFIVPAMGSHGGGTAEGQSQLLADYGITEQNVGAPVVSSIETVQVGTLPNGTPLYCDKNAYFSDAIVLINRVKPHTDFKGMYESGLVKMMVIGLGKHKGATAMHTLGFGAFHQVIPEAGKIIMEHIPLAIGVAVLENANDETAEVVVMPAEDIFDMEPILLDKAKSYMPRLLLDSIDVLVIDEIGKDISGAGMDPNIIGRTGSGITEGFQAPPIQKIVVRDLTEKTHGNASGIGLADVIPARLFHKIDFAYTYTNCITSTALLGAKIPVVLRSDKEALAVAVKTCNQITPDTVKMVWIKNTLELGEILISETYLDEIHDRDDIELTGELLTISFDSDGNVLFTQAGVASNLAILSDDSVDGRSTQ